MRYQHQRGDDAAIRMRLNKLQASVAGLVGDI
jgi:hypothetical protein